MPTIPAAKQKIALKYGDVEEVLMGLMDIHETRRSALVGRIRVFRDRNFPPNENKGTGARFTYDLDALIRLCLGFRLIDGLVPQELVPTLVDRHWRDIRAGFEAAFVAIQGEGSDSAASSMHRPILVVEPHVLASFSQAKSDDGEPVFPLSVRMTNPAALIRTWGDGPMPGAALTFDIQWLAGWIRDALLAGRHAVAESFVQKAAHSEHP